MFPDGTRFLQVRLARLRRRLAALQTANRTDSLTERELAVLQLLPGTLSLREIAEKLYVSLNTVKTHVQAIYRKLGVFNQRRRRESRPGYRDALTGRRMTIRP